MLSHRAWQCTAMHCMSWHGMWRCMVAGSSCQLLEAPVLRPLSLRNVFFLPVGCVHLHRVPQAPHFPICIARRWLGLAAQHPDWSPASHHRFLPSFRSAARTLLLVARRGGSRALGSSAGDGSGEA